MSHLTLEVQPTPTLYLTTINGKSIYVKHDYLNHPEVSGNKLRKLKYTLIQAKSLNCPLLSFGGAYSNHIAALAAAGKYYQLKTIGVIRGDELSDATKWSETLKKASNNGMQLYFVSREAYRKKESYPHVDICNIIEKHSDAKIIPEGGSDSLSVKGTSEVIEEIAQQVRMDIVFTACGTGGTLAGFIDGVAQASLDCRVVGVPVINSDNEISDKVIQLSNFKDNVDWTLCHDYSFGGYAKSTPELKEFMVDFERRYEVPLDPIYTVKLFYAVLNTAFFSKSCVSENWVIYHSGGLQGRVV